MSISSELKEIEEKQDELLRRRKEILRSLHKVEEDASRDGVKLEGIKRRNSRPAVDGSDPSHVNEADFQTRKKHRNNYGGESSFNKKLSSAISVPEDVSKKAGVGAGKDNAPEFKTEKPELRTSTGEVRKRNSNLFRNMLGHLDRAKATLEKQKPLLEKQDHAVHEAEHKNQEESSKLKEDFVKNLEQKRKQLLEDKMILEKSIIEKDKLRLLKKTELYFSDISNYILTKEKPSIFWKPAKTKEIVNKLSEETKSIINGKKEKAINLLEEMMKANLEALENADIEKLEPLDEKEDKEENENEEKKESDRKNRDRDDDGSEDSGVSDIEKEINNE